MADELVDEGYRRAVVRAAIQAVCRFEESGSNFFMAADMAYRVPCNDGWYAVEWTIGNWAPLPTAVPIVQDVFGDPFRPVVLAPALRAWHEDLPVSMARRVYESRDFADMPVLGDALEEAGCDDLHILDHLRGPGPHVRGCWVLDLLLSKS